MLNFLSGNDDTHCTRGNKIAQGPNTESAHKKYKQNEINWMATRKTTYQPQHERNYYLYLVPVFPFADRR